MGATIARRYVGKFVTSLEMAGASVTVMLLDDELRALLDAPTRTPRLVGDGRWAPRMRARAADAVEAARDELGRLDAVAGDGDHGVTMTLAARTVRARLDEAPDVDGGDLLAEIAPAVASVSGAIGPL